MLLPLLAKLSIEIIERGWMPDAWTRWLVRRLCQRRLAELRRGHKARPAASAPTLATQLRGQPVALVPEKANEQHYELPAEFFELMLGDRAKYSCCFFPDSDSTLDQAERQSLEMTCQHAEIADGMDVLELGCGWGSLTLWMLRCYPRLRVTAVSNSHSQRRYILQQARDLGLSDRLVVVTADMNDFHSDRKFDRVVSVEMFEHMRNYQLLLRRIATWLRPGGKLLVHIFCHRDFAYEFHSDGATNWMGRYFFTGGIMPSVDLLGQFSEDLEVADQWIWNGTHYQRTCNAWLDLLDQRRDQALAILKQTYGPKLAHRWLHRWRLFLMAGAELFGFQQGSQWMIGHFLLEQAAAHENSDRHPGADPNRRGAVTAL